MKSDVSHFWLTPITTVASITIWKHPGSRQWCIVQFSYAVVSQSTIQLHAYLSAN